MNSAIISKKPAQSRVEFAADHESLGLIIPPGLDRTTGWVFMLIAVFWNFVSWTIFVSVAIDGRLLQLVPIGIVALLGIGFLGVALYFFRGEFTLSLDRRECQAIWRLYRWTYSKKAETAAITDVGAEVFYTSNDQPVYGIAIRHGGRAIKFGSALKPDEREWLIAEIRQFLNLAA